ncbi:hypothetical protein ACH4VX_16440 [Streptomyces sp. NPDC020731]|uniref:hypothetical protein n=1 Tax=Streptomyces sp. NPDC020731 TaxID=3365085 RepID=UPI0037A3B321
MDEEAITIRLSRDQAFVLSDWLHQVMFQSDDLEGIVHDRAVWSPAHAISGTLDKELSEILMPDYSPRSAPRVTAVVGTGQQCRSVPTAKVGAVLRCASPPP